MEVNETVTSKAGKLSVVITDSTPDEQVPEVLHDVCSAYGEHNGTLGRLQLVIGRVLVVIRERKLFKATHKTFDRYMVSEVIDKYGISRASIFNGLQIAQTVPEISVQDATAIGIVKVRDIARAIKHETPKFNRPEDKTRVLDKMVKQAPKGTATEFRKWLEAGNLLTPRTSPQRATTIVVRGTPDLIAQWEQVVGERDPAEVLAELLAKAPAATRTRGTAGHRIAGARMARSAA